MEVAESKTSPTTELGDLKTSPITVPHAKFADSSPVADHMKLTESIAVPKSKTPESTTMPISTPILAAKFTMVARDPLTGKAAPVNQLRLDSEEERRLCRLAAAQRARLSLKKPFCF